eukprot:CAMPEP_0119485980 /NCGR_PEP_ID=MMETSP1344-20130328/12515_1 /TAXON_ID=236787 /ORGANISM="Florenciella parvula, Strain CCMP2471" /LENGTH=102 /DNA_ID=CAMNT_0007520693 /DNA_START=13 /DNA_END=318 /DNA_ORIENTATION=-
MGSSDQDDDDDKNGEDANGHCAWPGATPLAKEFMPFIDILLMFVLLVLIWAAGGLRRRFRTGSWTSSSGSTAKEYAPLTAGDTAEGNGAATTVADTMRPGVE